MAGTFHANVKSAIILRYGTNNQHKLLVGFGHERPAVGGTYDISNARRIVFWNEVDQLEAEQLGHLQLFTKDIRKHMFDLLDTWDYSFDSAGLLQIIDTPAPSSPTNHRGGRRAQVDQTR